MCQDHRYYCAFRNGKTCKTLQIKRSFVWAVFFFLYEKAVFRFSFCFVNLSFIFKHIFSAMTTMKKTFKKINYY
jgi:hypothetical protein